MQKGISVVIPNYNGEQLFPQTLPTVFIALQRIQLPYEVIIVDDCSIDGSVYFIEKNFPKVKILKNPKNSGFSVTANHGIKAAQFNLVLLLNSDIKLEPSYFVHQLRYFDQEDTFGVMGRIVGWNDDTIQDGAKYPSFHGVKIKTSGNYLLKNEDAMNEGLLTIYLSGANALLDRAKFMEIGGFDELFSPFYVEDYELSLRAWRYGYKCYYDYQSVCRHQTSSSIRSKNKKNFIKKIYNRNKMYLHGIHLPTAKRYLYYFQLFFEVLIKLIIGHFYFIKSLFLFIANYSGVRRSRERMQKSAKARKLLSIDQVMAIVLNSFTGKDLRRL